MRLARSLRSFWSTEIWCRVEIARAVLAGGTRIVARSRFDSALGLLRNRLLVRDFHVHLDLQPVVALPQFVADLFGFVHRLLQPRCLGPQAIPGGELEPSRMTNRLERCYCSCRCHAGLGIVGLVLLLGGLVTVELALNPAEAVSPGADQVSL